MIMRVIMVSICVDSHKKSLRCIRSKPVLGSHIESSVLPMRDGNWNKGERHLSWWGLVWSWFTPLRSLNLLGLWLYLIQPRRHGNHTNHLTSKFQSGILELHFLSGDTITTGESISKIPLLHLLVVVEKYAFEVAFPYKFVKVRLHVQKSSTQAWVRN